MSSPHVDIGGERRALRANTMRAFRWTGSTDRITVEIEQDGIVLQMEMAVLEVHAEPDQYEKVFEMVSRDTPAAGSVEEFAVLKFCRTINGS